MWLKKKKKKSHLFRIYQELQSSKKKNGHTWCFEELFHIQMTNKHIYISYLKTYLHFLSGKHTLKPHCGTVTHLPECLKKIKKKQYQELARISSNWYVNMYIYCWYSEHFWQCVLKLNTCSPHSAFPLLGIPKISQCVYLPKIYTRMFMASLFLIAKIQKQPKCPPVGERINDGIFIQWNTTS